MVTDSSAEKFLTEYMNAFEDFNRRVLAVLLRKASRSTTDGDTSTSLGLAAPHQFGECSGRCGITSRAALPVALSPQITGVRPVHSTRETVTALNQAWYIASTWSGSDSP